MSQKLRRHHGSGPKLNLVWRASLVRAVDVRTGGRTYSRLSINPAPPAIVHTHGVLCGAFALPRLYSHPSPS